jgi:hypothetical protein
MRYLKEREKLDKFGFSKQAAWHAISKTKLKRVACDQWPQMIWVSWFYFWLHWCLRAFFSYLLLLQAVRVSRNAGRQTHIITHATPNQVNAS